MPHLFPHTTFGLLRHGKTLWNEQKRIQGSSDSPLSPAGEQESGRWLPVLSQHEWDRILASPLPRVRQTVEILNNSLKLPVTFDQQLREQDWGSWEGKTLTEIENLEGEELQRQTDSGWNFTPPGGESRKQVLKRVKQTITMAARQWPNETILVVSHQSVMKCLLYEILGHPFLPDGGKPVKKNRFHLISHQHNRLQTEKLNIARK